MLHCATLKACQWVTKAGNMRRTGYIIQRNTNEINELERVWQTTVAIQGSSLRHPVANEGATGGNPGWPHYQTPLRIL